MLIQIRSSAEVSPLTRLISATPSVWHRQAARSGRLMRAAVPVAVRAWSAASSQELPRGPANSMKPPVHTSWRLTGEFSRAGKGEYPFLSTINL